MLDTVLNLVILEGPAGAGKSTLVRRLIKEGLVRVPQPIDGVRFDRPRGYEFKDSGAALSTVKDFASFTSAFSEYILDPLDMTSFLIDRAFISQHIYKQLRTQALPTTADFRRYLMSCHETTSGLLHNLTRRFPGLSEDAPQVHIYFNYAFLIPEVETVDLQRKVSGREYPYPAHREINQYNHVADYLVDTLAEDSCIKTTEPQEIVDWIATMPEER